MANKRVIPICHSGLSHKNLPQPLASLQAYTLSDPKDFNNLVELLAKAAELKTPNFYPIRLLKSLPKNEIYSTNKYSEKKSDDNKIGSFRNDIVRHDISALRSNYEFDKRTGIHKHMMTSEPVCTACLLQGIESPLTESDEGWQCNNRGCDKFYLNPNYNPPGTEDMDDNLTDY